MQRLCLENKQNTYVNFAHVIISQSLTTRTTSWSLFDLAPDGVYLAPDIAIGAGGLLHHRFTFIPKFKYRESLLSAALSISQVKLELLPLGGILFCGARTFLPDPSR